MNLSLNRFVAIVCASVAISNATFEAKAAEPQGFVLECRGGGALQIVSKIVMMGFEKKQIQDTVTITFHRASKPGLVGNVKPGECAWEDRAVASHEPNEIQDTLQGTLALTINKVEYGSGKPDELSITSDYGLNLKNPKRCLRITVWNDGQGHLQRAESGMAPEFMDCK